MTEAGNLEYTHINATAGAVTTVLAANNREYLCVTNESTVLGEDIRVSVEEGKEASATDGELIPAGGFWEPVTPPKGPVSVIALAGTPAICVTWG